MRTAIRTAAELDALDNAEVQEGYWDGRANEPEPGDNRSLSYWHGWRNGMMDGYHMKGDDASAAPAHDVIKSGWLRRLGFPKGTAEVNQAGTADPSCSGLRRQMSGRPARR